MGVFRSAAIEVAVPELPSVLVTGASFGEVDALGNVDGLAPAPVVVHQIEIEIPV